MKPSAFCLAWHCVSALAQLGDAVPREEMEDIAAKTADVRLALENRSTSGLKRAITALDAATQPLATRLIENVLTPPNA